MKLAEIQELVRKFILDRFPSASEGAIGDTDPLLEGGIVDSLGVLDIVTYLESEFDLPLSEDDLEAEDFESIAAIARFVSRKIGCHSPDA